MTTAHRAGDKATFPVGVSVLIVSNNKVLLGMRRGGKTDGWFSTPGGRIEPGETIADCAAREAEEETGLLIEAKDVKAIAFKEHMRFDMHYFMVYVVVRRFFGSVQTKEPDKCAGWDWIPFSEIPRPCTEPFDVLTLAYEEAA